MEAAEDRPRRRLGLGGRWPRRWSGRGQRGRAGSRRSSSARCRAAGGAWSRAPASEAKGRRGEGLGIGRGGRRRALWRQTSAADGSAAAQGKRGRRGARGKGEDLAWATTTKICRIRRGTEQGGRGWGRRGRILLCCCGHGDEEDGARAPAGEHGEKRERLEQREKKNGRKERATSSSCWGSGEAVLEVVGAARRWRSSGSSRSGPQARLRVLRPDEASTSETGVNSGPAACFGG